jgi:hypothetical protein
MCKLNGSGKRGQHHGDTSRVRRRFDEIYNQANFDNIGQMMASEYTKHGVLDRDTTTAQKQEEDLRENRTALPTSA